MQVHKPRLCHLVKGDGGYGFFLRDEDGVHVLDRIEDGGGADKAGVKNRDYVIEVNGENVESCDHDKVCNKNAIKNVSFLICFFHYEQYCIKYIVRLPQIRTKLMFILSK